MKKLLIVFAAVALVSTANAQKGSITFGLKAGANFYSIGGSDADDAGFDESRKTKIGIAGGAVVNIPVSSMFSVQPELLYSQEGNLQKEGDASAKINLGYLNLPILLQYNNPSGFYAETGPQIGLLMSAKFKLDDGTDETESDIKDDLKGLGFSWAIGAGYKLKSGLGFGARYNLGLSTLDDADEDASKLTSNGFHVGVFYMFGGKKK